MNGNYWDSVIRRRVSRRHALAVMGSTSAAAAFIAACGGDDDDSGSTGTTSATGGGATGGATGATGGGGGATSDLLITPTDQTATAKRGGTLNIFGNFSASNFEQLLSVSGSGGLLASKTYNTLTRQTLGTYDNLSTGEVEGEFAESWEMSPDGLTATYKIRPAVFDRRPPTSGKAATSADAKYSWDRFAAGGSRRQDLVNAETPDAPVLGVETPDDDTFVMKLAFPFAPLHSYMGSQFYPLMYPVEAEGGFDTQTIARGTGAFTFNDEDSARLGGTDVTMPRNPDYWDKERPYFENLRYYNIPDYSAIVAQFRAGALDFHNDILQEDVLQLKADEPKLQMYQRPFFGKGVGGVYFGRRPGSPWNDDRTRKALSMSLDRTLWSDTYSNRERFEGAGLPVEAKWNASAGPGYEWYLDPEKNELGEGSKNLQYDPEEAHKMLEATGLDLPVKSTWQTYPGITGAAGDNPLNVGMFGLMEADGDFDFDININENSQIWTNVVRYTGGDFDGHSLGFYFDHWDFDFTLIFKYHPSSPDFWMRLAGEDPKITDFVNRQRRELDPEKRAQIFQDYLRYDAEKMYYLPYYPASFKPFYLAQAWVGGWGWWQPWIEQNPGGPGQVQDSYWYDASKA
jgi:peptide/nickel transport system substrate-binding protein